MLSRRLTDVSRFHSNANDHLAVQIQEKIYEDKLVSTYKFS